MNVVLGASVVRFFRRGGGGGEGERVPVDLHPWRRRLGICMPACRKGGHNELFLYAFAFQFPLTGGRCFQGIFSIGGGASGGFMPLRRKGKHASPFSFAFPPLNFDGSGGRGGASLVGSLPLAAALLVYACQGVGRAKWVNFFLRFRC